MRVSYFAPLSRLDDDLLNAPMHRNDDHWGRGTAVSANTNDCCDTTGRVDALRSGSAG